MLRYINFNIVTFSILNVTILPSQQRKIEHSNSDKDNIKKLYPNVVSGAGGVWECLQ